LRWGERRMDDVDRIPTLLIPRAPRPYKTCIVCGMLYRGDDCPFCVGRDYTPKPTKKDRWVGRRKG
jgi:hypothetical protein